MNHLSVKCQVRPCTAVAVCGDCVICGCGNELTVFDLKTHQLVYRYTPFVGSTIHAIREGPVADKETLLCIFGGKQASVVSLRIIHGSVKIFSISHTLTAKDWILDAHWLQDLKNPNCISVALAHNSALLWDWKANNILHSRDCVEKCILYCARFIGNTWQNLIFAAGTVFNSIVLWPVGVSAEVKSCEFVKPVDVMHTFSGHKGVIFSIRYHNQLRRLCSVSDDRSIRIWQLTFPNSCLMDFPSLADWKGMERHELLCLYGHAARVWDVALLSSCFVSVGEDATCFVWNYDGAVLQKYKGHKGKSIWSLAASSTEQFVVTGGGDASIRIWNMEQSQEKHLSTKQIETPHTDQLDDFPRIVRLLNFDTLLIMMNSGSLHAYCVPKGSYQQIFYDLNFKSYSVVSPNPCQSYVAVGSILGVVKVISLKDSSDRRWEMLEEKLFDGKVLEMVWVEDKLLLCSGPAGQVLLLKIDPGQTEDGSCQDMSVTIMENFQLPPSKHCWVTCACCVTSGVTKYLVCGDKDGSVFLYCMREGSEVTTDACNKPLQSFYRVHGKTGVTSICERQGSIYSTGRDGFYRQWTIEDGTLSQLHAYKVLKGLDWIDHLEWHGEDLHVYGFFSSQFVVWSVPYNQQLVSVQCGGGHRAWGCVTEGHSSRFVYLKTGLVCMVDSRFQGRQTLLQPDLHGREICDVKFVPRPKGSQVPVICSASEDTCIRVNMFQSFKNLSIWEPLMLLKGHLSSVRSLALCPDTQHTNGIGSHFILFSGGGRAEMRAWKISIVDSSREVTTAFLSNEANREDNGHDPVVNEGGNVLSNPEQIHSNDLSFYHASSQDEQTSDSDRPHTTNISCSHECLCTYFLGESRHKQKFGPWKSRKLRLDPETRVMSISVSHVHDVVNLHKNLCGTGPLAEKDPSLSTQQDWHYYSSLYILSVAGSDGHLRVLSFDAKEKQFSIIATTFYHKCCVLQSFHYIHKFADQISLSFLVSASTRGDIVLWNFSQLVQNYLNSVSGPSFNNKNNSLVSDKKEDETDNVTWEEDYVSFTPTNSSDQRENKRGEGEDMHPVLCLVAHQSGVNSLHVFQESASHALVASGGDDNSISVYRLHFLNSTVELDAKGSKQDAHAAQITGIRILSQSLLVSTSIDQRVCVWSLLHENKTIQLKMIACKFIHIADISCLDVYQDGNNIWLCVAGEGMCLLSLDDNNC